MKFKITTSYNYYSIPGEDRVIAKFYCINTIPFTFDELEQELQEDPLIIQQATNNYRYTAEQIFKYSNYLILEEVHPLVFNIELDNPEELPV